MRILLTGFEPFGDETENSSSLVLDLIPDTIAGARIHKLILPVSFHKCTDAVTDFLHTCGADIIVALGQAGGRADISIERMAVNLAEAKKADNDGYQPHSVAVIEDAPAAYMSALPLAVLCDCVKEAGIPCHISDSAGLYVCNTLYYHLLHTYNHIPSCFIHLPYTLRQATARPTSTPSMSVETMVAGIRTVLEKLATT